MSVVLLSRGGGFISFLLISVMKTALWEGRSKLLLSKSLPVGGFQHTMWAS